MRDIEAIEKDLSERREKLAQLQSLKNPAKQRTERAQKERSSYVVAALTGNKEARKQMDDASEKLDAARVAEQDVTDAIGQVETAIVRLRAEAEASRTEALRQHALKLIEKRRGENREKRIHDLAVELEHELAALVASNADIVGAITAFDPERGTQAGTFLRGLNDPVRVDRGLRGHAPLAYFVSNAPQVHGTLLQLLRTESLRVEGAREDNASSGAAA